jgi:hypothetical protein
VHCIVHCTEHRAVHFTVKHCSVHCAEHTDHLRSSDYGIVMYVRMVYVAYILTFPYVCYYLHPLH